MKQIKVNINNVPDEDHAWLKSRAKNNGRTIPKELMHLVRLVRSARVSGAGHTIDDLDQFRPSSADGKTRRRNTPSRPSRAKTASSTSDKTRRRKAATV